MADLSSHLYGTGANEISLSSQAGENSNLDYFNSLPNHVKPMVNAVIEGRIPMAGRAPLDKKTMSQLFDVVANIDPTVDANTFNTRAKTLSDFSAAGQTGKKFSSIGGAMQHIQNLEKNYNDLNNLNFGGTYLNTPINAIERFVGVPKIQHAYTGAQRNILDLSGELANAFRQTGMAEADIKRELSALNPNMAPEDMRSAIENTVKDLEGRVRSQVESYNRTMHTNKTTADFLGPEAGSVYSRVLSGGSLNPPKEKQTIAQKQGDILAQPKKITNDAEYNLLPSGTTFVDPNGVTRTKP
jgi:hypothetical protein